jgi:hypothetical protein
MRKAGLEKGGEFSLENLVFKVLRRTSFMDQLDSFKAKSYDKLMSVTETLKESIMKDLIRQRLHEALKPTRFIPYDDKAELKQHSYSSLSKGITPSQLKNVKYKIIQAAKIVADYRREYNDEYMTLPTEGNGFYQLEIKHDGRLIIKQTKASGTMDQQQGPMTDVGTCKTSQNIARYCMVKAGKSNLPNNAYGASAGDDAANKALVIFKNEIMDFLDPSDYTSDPEKAAELAAKNMSEPEARLAKRNEIETSLRKKMLPSQIKQFDELFKAGKLKTPEQVQDFIKMIGKKAPLSVEPTTQTGAERKAARKAAQDEKKAKRQGKI